MVTFKINGTDFSSLVVKIDRTADKLDKFAERTLDGDIKREIIGTYVNYKLTFGNNMKNKDLYNQMFLELIRPVDFVTITMPVPVSNADYSFSGYIASVKDSVIYLSDKEQIYEGLECDIVTKKPTWRAGSNNPIWS
jgi:hypothetical protein